MKLTRNLQTITQGIFQNIKFQEIIILWYFNEFKVIFLVVEKFKFHSNNLEKCFSFFLKNFLMIISWKTTCIIQKSSNLLPILCHIRLYECLFIYLFVFIFHQFFPLSSPNKLIKTKSLKFITWLLDDKKCFVFICAIHQKTTNGEFFTRTFYIF